jgi:hypothetical protein
MAIRMQPWGVIGLVALIAVSARIQAAGAEFSAEIVRRGPDGELNTGKMFVGTGRSRMEMEQQGRQVIRIIDENRFMEWVLFPDEQSYLERGAPPGAQPAVPPPEPSAETSPCTIPEMTCRRVGVEDVNGRPAVKWEMTLAQQGQSLTGAQWLDQERGIPLKSVAPNGQGMELKVLGEETVDGRTVEKWEMVTTAPNQQPTSTFQWYDPELKLSIREEFPGGYVNELKEIRVGPQADDLFTVPAGYTRMSLPEHGGAQTPGAR